MDLKQLLIVFAIWFLLMFVASALFQVCTWLSLILWVVFILYSLLLLVYGAN